MTDRHVAADQCYADSGMILINVLIIVMLATAILAVMIAGDDTDVELSLRMNNAAQARAVAAGAELSAAVALRRDLARDIQANGSSDSYFDEWATIGDDDAAIERGRFTFAVTDAQALFNLNNLTRGDTLTQGTFSAIAAAAGLLPEQAISVIDHVRATGGLSDLADLANVGLSFAEIGRLSQWVTVLPEPTAVNLNTAPEALVAILLNNPGKARVLAAERTAARSGGGMTRQDLIASGIVPPPGSGVNSSYFWTRSIVEIGGDRQQSTSLLYRRTRDGGPQVLALKRWRGAAPIQVPPPSVGP